MNRPSKRELPGGEILRFILGRAPSDRSLLVGIDGGAGSGKTTFARSIAESLRETGCRVRLVHTDDFFRPSAERMDRQFPLARVSDMDWRRLKDQVLVPLRAGKPARYQLYDWPTDRLKDWRTIKVGDAVIIDGIAATRSELSDYYDLRIWFSCPREIRIDRLLGRGDTSAADIDHWMPSEDRYIASDAPEKRAHLVVDSAAENALTVHDANGKVVWRAPESGGNAV